MNIGTYDIILLLTGTIQPNSRDVLAVTDPEIRKQQYIDAINFYLKGTSYKVIFTENSGSSLESYFPTSNRLEFLTFISPEIVPDKGKGWKELQIIEYSLNNSKFIGDSSFIVKVTGRLKILNINTIVKFALKNKEPQYNLVLSNIYRKLKMDSRCFLFSKSFWYYLNKHGQSIDLHHSFEKALWQAVLDFKSSENCSYKQFSQPLRIEGISGGFGTPYNDGQIKATTKHIRHLLSPLMYPEILK